MREQEKIHALLSTEIPQCLESLAGEIVRPVPPPRRKDPPAPRRDCKPD